MYITPQQRAFWDQFINPFLDEVIGGSKGPPSQSGLTYALSRIIWGIYNRYPAPQVASGLRAVLADVRDEFTRRKLDAEYNQAIYENGDLPEGNKQDDAPSGTPTTTGNCSCDMCDVQEISSTKVIKLTDLNAHIEAGGTLESLIAKTPATPVKITPPENKKSVSNPKLKFPLIIDPAAEDEAEKCHLRAIKAFAIAKQSKASPAIITKLSQAVCDTLSAYLKTLGAP